MTIREAEDFYLKNNHAEVELFDGPFKGKYLTMINKSVKGYFEIDVPIYKDIYVPVKKGFRISISAFFGRFKYLFNTSVVLVKNSVFFVLIPELNEIIKSERRQFLRLDIILDLEINDFGKEGDGHYGYIVNLSGGGIQTVLNIALEVQKEYSLKFVLPDEEKNEIYAVAKVIRVEKKNFIIKKEGFSFALFLEFTAINENYRDKIVKFLLQIQLMRHRLNKKPE